jgi:hypothetical protein
MKSWTWFLLLGAVVVAIPLGFAVATEQTVESGFIPAGPSETRAYSNVTLGFTLRGPQGWSVLSQAEDEHGKPLYPDLPPGLRCVFRKNYPDAYGTFFASTLELSVGSTDGRPALEKLEAAARANPGAVLVQPKDVMLGEKTWATCETRMTADVGQNSVPVTEKYYMRLHRGAEILIQGRATSQEYEADVRLFDDAVSRIRWYDKEHAGNALTPILEDVVKNALERSQERNTVK